MTDSVIKRKRKVKGFTITSLAQHMEVSEATIKRWQNKSFSPDCKQVIKLSKALGIGITTLVNDYKEKE
jgi:ribosome-binding protein aMBF1 (putative translation factor)